MEVKFKVPNLQEIVIAALLHDIGKFYQRANDTDKLENDYEVNYCVDNNNYFSYIHSGYTAKFFDENKKIFNCFESYDSIKEISAMHHRPNTIFQKIISAADQASAGMDRVESEQESKSKEFRNIPLNSLFSLINFSENSSNEKRDKMYNEVVGLYGLKELNYKNVYPESDKGKITNLAGLKNYKDLYNNFISEINATYLSNNTSINSENYTLFEANLLRIIEKYLWCLPSATNDETKDISLYDHLYTTASIASTLYIYLRNEYNNNWEDKLNSDINKDIKFARLLKVDVSGIQNYIFDIRKTTFSAKMLRAKSFEISVMIKAISQKIKDSLGLDQVNILFEGGGNLQMLIPNNHSILKKLDEIKREIEESVFEKYFGELNFIFSLSDPLTLDDFNIKQYVNKVRKDIEKKSERSKLNKLQRILREKGHILSEIYEKLVNKKAEDFRICQICEKRPTAGNEKEFDLEKEADAKDNIYKRTTLCQVCNNLIEIGKELTRTKHFILTKKITRFNLLPDLFIDFRENSPVDDYIKNKELDKIYQIYSLDTNSSKNIFGLRWANSYHVPVQNFEPLTFEEISEKSTGSKKLAMLKGDVNDLGAIFWFGIKRKNENILTLSRYANLSRMFDYFFSEVLVKIIKDENEKYKVIELKLNEETKRKELIEKELFLNDKIYVVYSGGDDFTLIGSWDAIIEFSIKLYEYFKKYTCNNESIDFSCAIGMFNSKTPPLYMADVCEQDLHNVKARKDKFNVSVFNEMVNWTDFIDAIKNGKELIKNYYNVAGFSRSFIYKMLRIFKMRKDFEDVKNASKNAKWKALFKYYFVRNIYEKNSTKDEKVKEKMEELEDFLLKKIIENKGGGIAIKYALQATRE